MFKVWRNDQDDRVTHPDVVHLHPHVLLPDDPPRGLLPGHHAPCPAPDGTDHAP